MKKFLQTLLLCALVTLTAQAKGWDQQQYKQIEQSIRQPQFANREFPITKYGAKPANTAAKNQKAIQKAIDKCSSQGRRARHRAGRTEIPDCGHPAEVGGQSGH